MYAGIDMGTSSVKVALMGPKGEIVDSASSALTVESPQPLWNEQDPESWWTAANIAIKELRSRQDLSKVKAIGLSGQMHGATLIDKDNKVLRPCILWCDGRSYRECAEIEAAVPSSKDITGNLVMPGFTAGKLLWVKKYEPEIFAKTAKVLLPKDYLRMRMTGEYASDMSDASGTMWMNTGKRTWSPEMLAATHLTEDHMPKLFEGSAITGHLTSEVAHLWGMSESTVVVGGGGDNEAGAIGAGLYEPGQAMLSLGTSGVYFIVSDGFHYNTKEAVHSFCHAIPNRWHLMSVMLSCAVCLDWASKLTGCKNVAHFVAEAEKSKDLNKRPLYFLPYLSGERTPHNNANAKGVFFGFTGAHGRPELARAVLEGVSFAMADGMDAVHRCNVKPTSISLIGGGSRSPFWRQMLSDVSGLPLNYCRGSEVGPALGACRLAQIAIQKDTPLDEILTPLHLKQTHLPDMHKHQKYLKRRQVFRQLYKQLKPVMSPAASSSAEAKL